jgi:hypothetical protein
MLSAKDKMNNDLRQLFESLVGHYWTFLHDDWPVVEKQMNHRSDTKEITGIEIVKNYVLERLGYIPVFFFLVVLFSNKDYPGPYRGVEKGLLILYHILTGASMAQMGQFIPKSSFNAIYNAFYAKQLERLNKILDDCLAKMFSNVKIRVMSAREINPNEFKHVTMMIDGHDSRATYINASSRADYYSYKLKKSGFRTQVGMDINSMIMFVSKAAPCATNNDGSMLVSIDLSNKISRFDVVCVDGGYTLFINRILHMNTHLQIESFVTPVRRSRGVNLSAEEIAYNQLLGGFRSSIESRFGELGHLFHRFNGNSVIRVSDDAVFSVQFKLACVLSNMKRFVAMGQLQHTDHHTFWMHKDFDYYGGAASTSSVYDVVDILSISDRRAHKEKIEMIQQQLFSTTIDDEIEDNNNDDNDIMQEVDGGEEYNNYEVERIIIHRHTPNGIQYKVKWIGYDNRSNKWLFANQFNDDGNMIQEYMITLAED